MAKKAEVVVITGASAGVGRATAQHFARHRARVALLARGTDRLDAAAREVEQLGGQALVIPTDVSDAAAVEAAADRAEQTLGPIDIWINDAMVTVFGALKDITPEEYRRATEVTYLGTVWGTMAALRRMLPRDQGTIVQVGSALSYRAIPLQAPYCGAKHAIRGFTDSLRSELIHAKSRVHITMVQLAAFNTPQFDWGRTHMPRHPQPLPPIFQPEVAARGIYFAAHHRRRELWVGAPSVKTILGNKLLPGYADRKLAKAAYGGQQTDEPIPPDRPDNLFTPPPGDFGTHGSFDTQAKDHSRQLWWSMHRTALMAGVAVVVVVAIGLGVMWGTA